MDDLQKEHDKQRQSLLREYENAKTEFFRLQNLAEQNSISTGDPGQNVIEALEAARIRAEEAYRQLCDFDGTEYRPFL